MVQRKLGINSSSNSLKPEKKPSTNTKPSIQTHDHTKSKGAELSKKMKKSRSFKRSSDSDNQTMMKKKKNQLISNHPPSSPMKAASSSPNYMKSTTSSEARKEQIQVPKSVTRSISKRLFSPSSASPCSSLKKVRSLTKAPSFKPSRSIKSVKKCSKAALCEDPDVKRATCSSTMKDSKFPPYLDLNPGATQSQGTSLVRVCPYNYCSLNGHRHSAAPPLKSFISARRRMMKMQKSTKPVVSSPCKAKPSKEDVMVNEEKPDSFIEVYFKEVSEVSFEKPPSEGGKFDWESSSSVAFDDLFAESSDMEWEDEEEGGFRLAGWEMEDEISNQSDRESDQQLGNEALCSVDEESFNKDGVDLGFLKEFLAEEVMEFPQDEITDFHEQSSDSGSSTYDAYQLTEIDQFLQDCGRHGDPQKSQGECDEVLVTPTANEDKTEESPILDEATAEASAIDDEAANDYEETDEKNSGFAKTAPLGFEEEGNSDRKGLFPVEIINETVEVKEAEDLTKSVSEEQCLVDNKSTRNAESKRFFKKGSSVNNDFPEDRNMLKIKLGRRRSEGDLQELKSFNPRGPNFLEVEADPEAEKVDLRHQEMEERRNSEEWMVDYALRRAVDQLAPARKKKVALLVEAFEKVTPPPCNRVRPVSSGFARIQMCN